MRPCHCGMAFSPACHEMSLHKMNRQSKQASLRATYRCKLLLGLMCAITWQSLIQKSMRVSPSEMVRTACAWSLVPETRCRRRLSRSPTGKCQINVLTRNYADPATSDTLDASVSLQNSAHLFISKATGPEMQVHSRLFGRNLQMQRSQR